MDAPQETLPGWRQLRRNGVALLGVGVLGTLVMMLVDGGFHWSNVGLALIASSAVAFLLSEHKRRAASREDAASLSR